MLQLTKGTKTVQIYKAVNANIAGAGGLLRFDPASSTGPFVTPTDAQWNDEGTAALPAFPVPRLNKGVYLTSFRYVGGGGNAMEANIGAYSYPYEPNSQFAQLAQFVAGSTMTGGVPMSALLVAPEDGFAVVQYWFDSGAAAGRTLSANMWLLKIA
jgi:hypothetical protein